MVLGRGFENVIKEGSQGYCAIFGGKKTKLIGMKQVFLTAPCNEPAKKNPFKNLTTDGGQGNRAVGGNMIGRFTRLANGKDQSGFPREREETRLKNYIVDAQQSF